MAALSGLKTAQNIIKYYSSDSEPDEPLTIQDEEVIDLTRWLHIPLTTPNNDKSARHKHQKQYFLHLLNIASFINTYAGRFAGR